VQKLVEGDFRFPRNTQRYTQQISRNVLDYRLVYDILKLIRALRLLICDSDALLRHFHITIYTIHASYCIRKFHRKTT
jgi:hypothetical protein